MHSFEGQYRRTPQQKLSGDSYVLGRDELLSRARQQRQERENHRKRIECCTLIQSYTRSYLVRTNNKRQQRVEFDQLLKDLSKSPNNAQKLEAAVKRLLFFYWPKDDKARLVSLVIDSFL